MAVGFETVKELDDLWAYHKEEKLSPLLHEILLTSSVMEAADVTNVRLVVKLWDDEYEACKHELDNKTTQRVDISDRRE